MRRACIPILNIQRADPAPRDKGKEKEDEIHNWRNKKFWSIA